MTKELIQITHDCSNKMLLVKQIIKICNIILSIINLF